MSSTPTSEKETSLEPTPVLGHPSDVAVTDAPAKVNWYRGTTFQAIVVGLAGFLAPGCYGALAATGAGGLANVDIGNASVALAYALIVPSALFATSCISKIGMRWTLAIGCAGYVFYSAALYTNSAYGNQWFLILGAILCGLTSGLFWVGEGVLIMTYSEPGRKGRLVAIWQSLYTSATCIGGAINLGLNINIKVKGGLRPKTYIVFIALNCLAPLSAFLVSNPKQVQRKDGKPVPKLPAEGFFKEAWLVLAELRDPRVFACAFLWSQSLFIGGWQSTYLAKNFSVRVRGMSSLAVPVFSILCFQIMGFILDNKKIRLRQKLTGVWAFINFILIATTIWIMVIEIGLAHQTTKVTYDWLTPGFAAHWVPLLFARMAQGVSYGFYYYMAGYIYPKETEGVRVSRIIATLRSAESGSAAIAYGINSIGLLAWKIGVINLVFCIVAIVSGGYVLQWIWVQDKAGMFDESEPAEVAVPAVEDK